MIALSRTRRATLRGVSCVGQVPHMADPERLVAILAVEAAFGWPARFTTAIGHPVIWIGTLIASLDARWNRGRHRRAAGIVLLGVLIGLSAAAGIAIERIAGPGWGSMIVILVATAGLAQRSLHDHVAAVLAPLATGDLAAARSAVARIVGRDTAALEEAGIATAAIESLAESFCDGVVAPAFWFLLLGLPGLCAAKAINTADSMVGHRTPRHAAFGWASARADDVVNFIPARIAGVLLCLAGRGGWRTMWHNAPAHASPNGGWPEAAMAGVLRRRLGGPVAYDGEHAPRARLGDGPPPDAADLTRALRIYRIACVLLWLAVGGIAWVR